MTEFGELNSNDRKKQKNVISDENESAMSSSSNLFVDLNQLYSSKKKNHHPYIHPSIHPL